MNFTSELKLQIWVMKRLINTVHFLHKSRWNQKEFDTTSHQITIHETSLWWTMNNANPMQPNVNPPNDMLAPITHKKGMHACMMSLI